MARARNIKPALFKNEVLGVADPLLTLLFQSLWCLADKEGRLEDRPMRIKAETFPYREKLDINRYLTDLQRMGFIVRYEVDGNQYIQVVNFKKHQNPHHTERDSEIPENQSKSIGCDVTVNSPLNTSYTPSDSLLLIPDSLISSFDAFWKAYPKKEGKEQARKAFKKVKPDLMPIILKAIENQKQTDKWKNDGGKYIPNPATWINGKRWEDEINIKKELKPWEIP